MSYYARSTDSNICIDRKHFASILQDAGLNPYSPGVGVDGMIARWLSETGFIADFDSTGNIDSVWFEYGRFDSSEVEGVLHIIAPYVLQGGSIGFVGQDDDQWAYTFDGHTYKECYAITIYPEIPGDCGSALYGVKNAHQYLFELFGDQVDQLDPTIEQEIERLKSCDDYDIVKAARTVLLNRLANSQPSASYMNSIEQLSAFL